MTKACIAVAVCVAFAATAHSADWQPLFNGKNLAGWEPVGDCIWTVTDEGNLMGRRPSASGKEPFGPWPVTAKAYRSWLNDQAWLYTTREFGAFDLHVEYWVYSGGNSGVSLFDSSRGKTSFSPGPIKTPAHIGYEIQILGTDEGDNITGAIYGVQPSKPGLQHPESWNTLDIEARPEMIRIMVNGKLASEHAPVPDRPKVGPIGLQLHDRFSWAMFRNVRIREIAK